MSDLAYLFRVVTLKHDVIELCRQHLDARAERATVRGTWDGLANYDHAYGVFPGAECADCLEENTTRVCADCGHAYTSRDEEHECRQQRGANRRAERRVNFGPFDNA